jgi:hypothetical protein
MKNFARGIGALVLLVICLVLWYAVASDYGDGVASGTYHFARGDERSTLTLKPDHSFQQELNRQGQAERSEGTWRRSGMAGIEFSKEFLRVSGQEIHSDGTAFGEMQKTLGFLVSIVLSQYQVVWYGRIDPSNGDAISGTYAGDEPGVRATLLLKPDHTFEQRITNHGVEKHAVGSWSLNHNGDIVFSTAFLKTSGESLGENEIASAWNPKGSNLQTEIAVAADSGSPTFRKRQFLW